MPWNSGQARRIDKFSITRARYRAGRSVSQYLDSFEKVAFEQLLLNRREWHMCWSRETSFLLFFFFRKCYRRPRWPSSRARAHTHIVYSSLLLQRVWVFLTAFGVDCCYSCRSLPYCRGSVSSASAHSTLVCFKPHGFPRDAGGSAREIPPSLLSCTNVVRIPGRALSG